MEPKNKAAIVEEKDDELVLTDEEFVSTDEMEDSLNAEYEDVAQFHSGELVNRLSNDIRVMNDRTNSVFHIEH